MSISVEDLQAFLKGLASETRQRILLEGLSGAEERTVGDVARRLGLGQPTVSEHLSLLKRGGLVRSEKRGREVYYRTDRQGVLNRLDALAALLRNCC